MLVIKLHEHESSEGVVEANQGVGVDVGTSEGVRYGGGMKGGRKVAMYTGIIYICMTKNEHVTI